MVFGIIRTLTRLTATGLFIGTLTYAYHPEIDRFINDIKFYLNESEKCFVEKEHSLNLNFNRKINGKGNLETYLVSYSQELPIYMRENGIMVGSSEYNYSNFTLEEREELCEDYKPTKIKDEKPRKKDDPIKRTLRRLYDLIRN